ncbi:hypothetical protein ASZ90_009246 [hydrocarbon metagenome]|uniref:Uncharacterized protein n=1 Tax=hydrocarbon metagenome TaxID=938273 RepID=A0A0W8FK74_9ZZZZ
MPIRDTSGAIICRMPVQTCRAKRGRMSVGHPAPGILFCSRPERSDKKKGGYLDILRR